MMHRYVFLACLVLLAVSVIMIEAQDGQPANTGGGQAVQLPLVPPSNQIQAVAAMQAAMSSPGNQQQQQQQQQQQAAMMARYNQMMAARRQQLLNNLLLMHFFDFGIF